MSLARRVAGNTLLQVIGRLVVAITSVLTLSLILHGFGASLQGKYLLALSYAQFVGTIADFGLNSYLVRSFSLPKNDREAGQVLPFRLALSLLFFGAGALIVCWLPYDPEARRAVWLALAATFFLSLNSVFVAFYQARLAMAVPVLGDLANRFVTLLGTYLVLRLQLPFIAAVWAVLLGGILNVAVLAVAASGRFLVARTVDLPAWRSIAVATFPIWVTTILSLIYFRIDSLLLSVLPLPAGHTNLTELANYGTAYKFLEILIALPGMLLGTLMPLLVRAEADRSRFSELVRHATYLISLFAAPIVVGTYLVADQLVGTFFPELAPAAVALRILIWAFACSALASAFIYAIVSAGEQRRLVWPYLGISLANVVLNLAFIPKFGFVGAAWTTVVSEALVFLGGWYVAGAQARLVDAPFDARCLRPWLAAAGMGVCVLAVPGGLGLRVAAGIASYAALLGILGGIDQALFRKLWHRA